MTNVKTNTCIQHIYIYTDVEARLSFLHETAVDANSTQSNCILGGNLTIYTRPISPRERIQHKLAHSPSKKTVHVNEEPEFKNVPQALSPRGLFILGCVDANLPPVARALIRNKITPVLDLSSFGIGTHMCIHTHTCIHIYIYIYIFV